MQIIEDLMPDLPEAKCCDLIFKVKQGQGLIKHFCLFVLNVYLFIWLCQILIAAHGIFDLTCSMWDIFPRLGIEPWSPALGEVLAPGPLGKSSNPYIFSNCQNGFNPSYFDPSLYSNTDQIWDSS